MLGKGVRKEMCRCDGDARLGGWERIGKNWKEAERVRGLREIVGDVQMASNIRDSSCREREIKMGVAANWLSSKR